MALIPDTQPKKISESTEEKEKRISSESHALFGTPARCAGKTTPIPPRPEVTQIEEKPKEVVEEMQIEPVQ